MIRHQALASSMLVGAAYDDRDGRLYLHFAGKNGKPPRYYSYEGVPQQIWTGLRLAESHGKYFLDAIRGAYTAREIDADDWHALMSAKAQHVTTISWELNVPLFDFAQAQSCSDGRFNRAGASRAAAV